MTIEFISILSLWMGFFSGFGGVVIGIGIREYQFWSKFKVKRHF